MSVVTFPSKNPNRKLAWMVDYVSIGVPDFEVAVKWYTEKMDFQFVYEWPYVQQKIVYVASANDDRFPLDLLAAGEPKPISKVFYSDLDDGLRLPG